MQGVKRECEQYGAVIDRLSEWSYRLIPVRKHHSVRPPTELRCACDYKDPEVVPSFVALYTFLVHLTKERLLQVLAI